MSGYLVGNGRNLYRRANSLVRSPILKTIVLNPDNMAAYCVAGEYAAAGSDYSPSRGFCSNVGLIGKDYAMLVGKQMRKAYLNISPATHQGWYRSSLRLPYFIFYHGQYGATAGNTFCAEAYMQVPAYHFTIPNEYAGFGIYGAALSVTHQGTILAYQRAGRQVSGGSLDYYASAAPTTLLPADSNWRQNWTQRIGIYSSLDNNLARMHNAATDDVVMDTARALGDINWVEGGTSYSKTGRYAPIIGNLNASYADDGLPCTFNPWTQSLSLSSSICNSLGTSKNGWIVISPDVGVSSSTSKDTDQDYPFYYPSNWGRWLACSFGAYQLSVTLQLG